MNDDDLIRRETVITAINNLVQVSKYPNADTYVANVSLRVDAIFRIIRAIPAVQPNVQCCMCGKKGLSTEEDGGPECELDDDRWVCSGDCWNDAVQPDAELAMRIAVQMEVHAALGTTTKAKADAIKALLNPGKEAK
jgi:hypothetical protein